jgi:hypothetical protein
MRLSMRIFPFSLVLRPPLRLSSGEMAIKVRYVAGYYPGKTPDNLSSLSGTGILEYEPIPGAAYLDYRESGAAEEIGNIWKTPFLKPPEGYEPYRRRTI